MAKSNLRYKGDFASKLQVPFPNCNSYSMNHGRLPYKAANQFIFLLLLFRGSQLYSVLFTPICFLLQTNIKETVSPNIFGFPGALTSYAEQDPIMRSVQQAKGRQH